MAVRRKAKPVEEATEMTEVTAEPFEDDPDWDGSVEEMPADPAGENDNVVEAPKRRGRAPLTLPAAAARFERAKAAVERLSSLDVETERGKILTQMDRLAERLARVDGHGTAVKAASEELSEAEAAFTAAVASVRGE